MLTIRHIIDKQNSTLYSATHVDWHVCEDANCQEEHGLTIWDGDKEIAFLEHNADGTAFIMNETGQTIGAYPLKR